MPVLHRLSPWKAALWPYLMHAGNSTVPLIERLSYLVGHPSLQDPEYQTVVLLLASE
jgi:hypothetical protein